MLTLSAVVLLGLALRLHGLHSPLLDHPGWRQGDTAAIARNFATLQYNILYPQTDYNGPPPNYVELELQIVPFLAATLYKIFGIHEVFGRLISLAFGLATIAVTGLFARRLFRSDVAGIAAAALYAVLPGSIYYSRTFMPDTAMVFFLTAAVYACVRWFYDETPGSWRGFPAAALLMMAAFLAKPVAVAGIIPVAAASFGRFGFRGTLTRPHTYALLAVAFIPLAAYGKAVNAHAEWHWASGIMQQHVVPQFLAALTSAAAFAQKLVYFRLALGMLWHTMLGPFGTLLLAGGLLVPLRRREGAVLYGWLAGALAYIYVVVTVERVDYYLYLVLPLAALAGGNLLARAWLFVRPQPWRNAAVFAAAVLFPVMTFADRRLVAPYYAYSKANYVAAKALDATLPAGALIVMGHYDPSILYYINRKGWEEDPYLWTPFDEQSAIRKGARAFVSVEHNRLRRNVELYAWLARFPVDECKRWPVYETDYAKVLPGAEERWRAFRRAEKAGQLPFPTTSRTSPSAPTTSNVPAASTNPCSAGSSRPGARRTSI
ncbi:MAG: ArnT family glycosyltransferase [Candidatus Velthaea sp.]